MPAGVVLYPKPEGVTSHAIVAEVRRRLIAEHGRGAAQAPGWRRAGGPRLRVGHAGTLDPFASGLILVLVGAATRAQRFLMPLPKTYRAVARLGWTSDTGDPEGVLTQTGRVPEDLEERLRALTGELLQRPPAYSAVKVGGEPLYKKARRGEAMEGAARPVTVHRLLLRWREGERAGIEVQCSAGTYVRQLVSALGDAYCERLERTRIGPFGLEDAGERTFVPLADALGFLPERRLDSEEAERVGHGAAVAPVAAGGPPGAEAPEPAVAETWAAAEPLATEPVAPPPAVRLTSDGRLLAVAEPRGGWLKPLVVFPE